MALLLATFSYRFVLRLALLRTLPIGSGLVFSVPLEILAYLSLVGELNAGLTFLGAGRIRAFSLSSPDLD